MDDYELLEALLAAVERGDTPQLEQLCRDHQQAIAARFEQWRRLPASQRGDPKRVRRHAEGLIAIAQLFDRELGDPGPLSLLLGEQGDNPITRWQSDFARVHGLMQGQRYQQAIAALEEMIESFEGLQGSAVDHYLPIVHGRLGECLFHTGAFREALAPTERALALCEAAGDENGVVAYLGNLVELHRRLGDHMRAQRYADRRDRLLAALRNPS